MHQLSAAVRARAVSKHQVYRERSVCPVRKESGSVVILTQHVLHTSQHETAVCNQLPLSFC